MRINVIIDATFLDANIRIEAYSIRKMERGKQNIAAYSTINIFMPAKIILTISL